MMGGELSLLWLLAECGLFWFAEGFNEGLRSARVGDWRKTRYVPVWREPWQR